MLTFIGKTSQFQISIDPFIISWIIPIVQNCAKHTHLCRNTNLHNYGIATSWEIGEIKALLASLTQRLSLQPEEGYATGSGMNGHIRWTDICNVFLRTTMWKKHKGFFSVWKEQKNKKHFLCLKDALFFLALGCEWSFLSKFVLEHMEKPWPVWVSR